MSCLFYFYLNLNCNSFTLILLCALSNSVKYALFGFSWILLFNACMCVWRFNRMQPFQTDKNCDNNIFSIQQVAAQHIIWIVESMNKKTKRTRGIRKLLIKCIKLCNTFTNTIKWFKLPLYYDFLTSLPFSFMEIIFVDRLALCAPFIFLACAVEQRPVSFRVSTRTHTCGLL